MMQHAPFRHHSHDRTRDRPRGREWLATVFHCRATQTGGIIRRQIIDVEREVGIHTFEQEVRKRGFRLIRARHHYVIVCDPGPVDVLF